MRILMISRDVGERGSASAAAERWRMLRDHGVEMEVILASPRVNGGWEEPGIHVRTSGGRHALARFYRLYRLGKGLVSQVDLITSEDPLELGVVAWLLARHGRKPFEMQDHAGTFEDVHTYEPWWVIRRWLSRFLLPHARVIRTVNPQSFHRLQSVYHHDAYWLPIAPHQRYFEAPFISQEQREELVVCVARLIPSNAHLLLSAFECSPSTPAGAFGDRGKRVLENVCVDRRNASLVLSASIGVVAIHSLGCNEHVSCPPLCA